MRGNKSNGARACKLDNVCLCLFQFSASVVDGKEQKQSCEPIKTVWLASLRDIASQWSIPCLSSCLQLCPVFVKIFDALNVAADASAG